MKPLGLLPLLALPALAQIAPEDAKVFELSAKKQWAALADHIESLSPKDRGRHVTAWMTALHRSGRNERALQVSEAILGQLPPHDPQVPAALEFKARAQGALGRHGEAAGAWERLAEIPGRFPAFANAAVEARNARDYPAMERIALKWQKARPEDPALPAILGEALARLDRFEEAEPVLQKAIALTPKDADAWSNLGRCLNHRKAWAEAAAALNSALTLDPKHLEARYNRGRTMFELARYKESVEDFQLALALAPEDPTLKENLHQAQRYFDAQFKSKKINK